VAPTVVPKRRRSRCLGSAVGDAVDQEVVETKADAAGREPEFERLVRDRDLRNQTNEVVQVLIERGRSASNAPDTVIPGPASTALLACPRGDGDGIEALRPPAPAGSPPDATRPRRA
jgi:hypothetical protein